MKALVHKHSLSVSDQGYPSLAAVPRPSVFALSVNLFAFCLMFVLTSTLPAHADHIHHIYYNNSTWQDEDLTALTAGPVVGSVSGIAAFETPGHQLHVYYPSGSYPWHVHQLYYNGKNWADQDLTAMTGAPGVFPDAISGFAVGNLQYVFYMGLDNHMHELNYNNIDWSDTDLTVASGGPQAAGDYVVAVLTKPNDQFHVYYDDYNAGDLHQLYFNGSSRVDEDLTSYTGGARCGGAIETSGYATGNLQQLFCQGVAPSANNFDMLHIYYNNSTWVYEDISWLTAGDLSMLPGAGQAAFAVGSKKELFGITPDYHVQQYEFSHRKWTRTDLTNAIGAPVNAYPGWMVGFITTPNDQFHIYYQPSTNGNYVYTDLYQLYYNGSAWSAEDLTSFTGAPQADALGGMAGFSIGNLQHVFYEAAGN